MKKIEAIIKPFKLDEVKEAPVVAPTAESVSEPTAEDDDAMSFFAKLAKED